MKACGGLLVYPHLQQTFEISPNISDRKLELLKLQLGVATETPLTLTLLKTRSFQMHSVW